MGCSCKQLNGAIGLSKAALQKIGIPVDRAPDFVVKARRDICRECPQATKNESRLHLPTKGLTDFSRCLHPKCGCFIAAKTKLASESCPEGKWLAFSFPGEHSPSGDGKADQEVGMIST